MSEQRQPRTDERLAGRRILSVTEEELQRIILDLHDGPVQQLFAARSQLAALKARSAHGAEPTAEEYQDVLERVSRLVEQSLYEIRNFLGTFRPPDFAHRDLVAILQGLIMHYELTAACEVRFQAPEKAGPVSLPVKIALYRICQEALSNISRHADADQIDVRLHVDENGLSLAVQDNGSGFTPPTLRGPNATEREEHIGLRGMRDRMDLVDGTFEVRSAPGSGTTITVGAPRHV
jgi:signal transduction histidine kinase